MALLDQIPKQKPHRPALRLVDTRRIERADWLEVRKTGIGGSDAAAAVGLSPYKSQLELWLEKTGRDADLQKPDPNDTTEPAYWGTLLEPIVAAAYTKQTGNRVRKVNAVLQHPSIHFMLANLDREVVGVPDVQILECKTAGEFGSRLWRDGVPEYVQLQVQHQLAVTNKASADVCVLLCGQEIRVHRIERDDALIALLIELERQFWHYVESDTPPPADGSGSAATALQCLYPRDSGHTIDFTHDHDMSTIFANLVSVRAEIVARELLESELKQRIQQRMGEAATAIFETGSVSWKRGKDGNGLDLARLLAEQPELLKHYPLVKPGSRRFLINV